MNIDRLLKHHNINENPFTAEEARLDPVFERMLGSDLTHPDFDKVLGRIDRPSTAVVFGEKGSGKTAIRLTLSRRIARHNRNHPDSRVLSVVYDDLNPILDRLQQARRQKPEAVLASFSLETHQDAILSLSVTRLVNALLGEDLDANEVTGGEVTLSDDLNKRKAMKQIPRERRVDLALLAAIYDQPRSGAIGRRLARLRKKLLLGAGTPPSLPAQVACLLAVLAGLGGGYAYLIENSGGSIPWWLWPAVGLLGSASLLLLAFWLWRGTRVWWAARRVAKEVPSAGRTAQELRGLFNTFKAAELGTRPLPKPVGRRAGEPARDCRYQLTRRFIDVLASFDYAGMIVLVDRIDEPTIVSGDAERMRDIVWPMFDNKFLKQDRLGLKMLLPIELRHLLHKESAQFFQEARLDKQNMIDRLTWTGATLYDLCNERLNACRPAGSASMQLTDLFADDVSREVLIDALDQMHQPRDAFKFLYAVLQEHARMTSDGDDAYVIAKLTLDAVRRDQARRVQELHRGLLPA